VAVPGALDAGLQTGLFWASLALSLVVAFLVTTPVNRALISHGRGHAVVHAHHGGSAHGNLAEPGPQHGGVERGGAAAGAQPAPTGVHNHPVAPDAGDHGRQRGTMGT
jgi:hypothetical protein